MVPNNNILRTKNCVFSEAAFCLDEDTYLAVPLPVLDWNWFLLRWLRSCKWVSISDGSMAIVLHILSVRENFEKIMADLVHKHLQDAPLSVEISGWLFDRDGTISEPGFPDVYWSEFPSFSLLKWIFPRLLSNISSFCINKTQPRIDGINSFYRDVHLRIFQGRSWILHRELWSKSRLRWIVEVGQNLYPMKPCKH